MNYRELRRLLEAARRGGADDYRRLMENELGVCTIDAPSGPNREGLEADLGFRLAAGAQVPQRSPAGTWLADKRERQRFSIRECFRAAIPDGPELFELLNPRFGSGPNFSKLVEAGEVDSSAFASISGQVVYNEILENFQSEEFVATKLIPTMQTEFNGEKLAGITRIGDQVAVVPEKGEYPYMGVSEDWIQTPVTVKRGGILELSKEAVFFDRTGKLLEEAANVGLSLGINREKRAIDCLVDENTTTHRYNWRGTVIASYDNNTGSHTWDNLAASNGLTDWTDLETADLLLAAITDPNSGEPIIVTGPMVLICTKEKEWTAKNIRDATKTHSGGYVTSGQPFEIDRGPYAGAFEVVTSRFFQTRMATDTDWFWGDVRGAFRWAEVWPITVVSLPANSHEEFHRDVIAGWKTSERGAYFVREPRLVVKSTA